MSGDGAPWEVVRSREVVRRRKERLCGRKPDVTVRYTTGLCGWCTRQVQGHEGTVDCGLGCDQRPGHALSPCRCIYHVSELIRQPCPFIYPNKPTSLVQYFEIADFINNVLRRRKEEGGRGSCDSGE